MNEHSELPFVDAKDMQGLAPYMMFAMWPWMMAGYMMSNAMSFWAVASRGNMAGNWAVADSLDHGVDAPAEELLVHEHVPPSPTKVKH